MGDELGQHGVVVRADLGAACDPGVDAQIDRKAHFGQQTGGGLEVLERIFRVQPGLDRVAARAHVEARQRRHFAAREPHHPLDQVDAGDGLGHAVFDLQARIDFEEEELLGSRIDDELDRACGAVRGRLRQTTGGGEQLGAHRVAQAGRRRLLDHLLVAPLQ